MGLVEHETVYPKPGKLDFAAIFNSGLDVAWLWDYAILRFHTVPEEILQSNLRPFPYPLSAYPRLRDAMASSQY